MGTDPDRTARRQTSGTPPNRDDGLSPPCSLLRPTWPITHVRTPQQLEQLCRRLNAATEFGLDTETWGVTDLSEKLCLIQIAIPDKANTSSPNSQLAGRTALIDVLALQRATPSGSNPLAPLAEALTDPDKRKIVHVASFQKAQFRKYAITLAGAIDTRVLAREIYPELLSYSLQACVFEILGNEMSKAQQTSPWYSRPLLPEQIEYAALDAEIVLKLYRKLREVALAAEPEPLWTIDDLMAKLVQTHTDRHQLIDRGETGRLLRTLALRRTVAHSLLEAALRRDDAADMEANYRGPYGVAEQERPPVERFDQAALRELFPDLEPQVSRQVTSKEAIATALAAVGRGAELDSIWRHIRVATERYHEPELTLQFDEPLPQAPLDDVTPPTDLTNESSKEELLHAILESDLGRLRVLSDRGLAEPCAVLNRRIVRYSERILELLTTSSPLPHHGQHVGPYGVAQFTALPEQSIDLARLTADYPDIAARCIETRATKADVAAALRTIGADDTVVQTILRAVFVPTGELLPVRVSIRPNYALFYRGRETP